MGKKDIKKAAKLLGGLDGDPTEALRAAKLAELDQIITPGGVRSAIPQLQAGLQDYMPAIRRHSPLLADGIDAGDIESIREAGRLVDQYEMEIPSRVVEGQAPWALPGVDVPSPPIRSLPDPEPPAAARRIEEVVDDVTPIRRESLPEEIVPEPRRPGPSPDDVPIAKLTDEVPPPRVLQDSPARRGPGLVAAAAAATGLGTWAVRQLMEQMSKARGNSLSDLQGGMPSVSVQEEPLNAREQAHALIKELNAKRRAAGGEIPDAPAMQAEIRRLLEMSDAENNSAMHKMTDAQEYPGPARDPHAQARNLIAQVNAMYRSGHSPNSPQVRQIMQEVSRLQRMGDEIRNRGTTAFPEQYAR